MWSKFSWYFEYKAHEQHEWGTTVGIVWLNVSTQYSAVYMRTMVHSLSRHAIVLEAVVHFALNNRKAFDLHQEV